MAGDHRHKLHVRCTVPPAYGLDQCRWSCPGVASLAYPDAVLAAEDPKITDWMQAWGSVAGLAMSTLAVLLTGILFRHEIRVRRDEKESAESAQAQLVVVGVDHFLGDGDKGWTGTSWFVRNESTAPISNLIVLPRYDDSIDYELFAGHNKTHKSLQIVTADSRVTGFWTFDDARPWRSWE
jgi:hypothetical protein